MLSEFAACFFSFKAVCLVCFVSFVGWVFFAACFVVVCFVTVCFVAVSFFFTGSAVAFFLGGFVGAFFSLGFFNELSSSLTFCLLRITSSAPSVCSSAFRLRFLLTSTPVFSGFLVSASFCCSFVAFAVGPPFFAFFFVFESLIVFTSCGLSCATGDSSAGAGFSVAWLLRGAAPKARATGVAWFLCSMGRMRLREFAANCCIFSCMVSGFIALAFWTNASIFSVHAEGLILSERKSLKFHRSEGTSETPSNSLIQVSEASKTYPTSLIRHALGVFRRSRSTQSSCVLTLEPSASQIQGLK